MESELLDDLLAELKHDSTFDKKRGMSLAESCVDRAIKKFRTYRCYPSTFTEADVENDMRQFYACILDLAFYCWDKQGIQFETTHTENTTQRTFISETTVFKEYGVCKYVQFL